MKKLITVLVVLLLVGAAAGFALAIAQDHYIKNQHSKPAPVATIPVTESDQKIAAAQAADETKYQTLVGAYNLQVTECQKGKTAYDKLSSTLKATTPAPTCGQAIALAPRAE